MFVQTHFQRSRHSQNATAALPSCPARPHHRQSKSSDCPPIKQPSSTNGDSRLLHQTTMPNERDQARTAALARESYRRAKSDRARESIPQKSAQSGVKLKSVFNCQDCCAYCSFLQNYRDHFSLNYREITAYTDLQAKFDGSSETSATNLKHEHADYDELLANQVVSRCDHDTKMSNFKYSGAGKYKQPSTAAERDADSLPMTSGLVKSICDAAQCMIKKVNLNKPTNTSTKCVLSISLDSIKFYAWLAKYFGSDFMLHQLKTLQLILDINSLEIQEHSGGITRQACTNVALATSSRPAVLQNGQRESSTLDNCSNHLSMRTVSWDNSRPREGMCSSCDCYSLRTRTNLPRLCSDSEVQSRQSKRLRDSNESESKRSSRKNFAPDANHHPLKNIADRDHSNYSDAKGAERRLSLTGTQRRLGFVDKKLNYGLRVQRSEEVSPMEATCCISVPETSSTLTESGTFEEELGCHRGLDNTMNCFRDTTSNFITGFGQGQITLQQALGSSNLGKIQLSLSDGRGLLEVCVLRVTNLRPKPNDDRSPSSYVKVYLIRNGKCIAKCKTELVAQSLNPIYQQKFIFRENHRGCLLQVIVWGDCKTKGRKWLMGIVQINLDKMDITNTVTDWYRLSKPASIENLVSSKNLRRMMLSKTL